MIGATDIVVQGSREGFRTSQVGVHPADGKKRSVVNTYRSTEDMIAVFEETPLDGHQRIG